MSTPKKPGPPEGDQKPAEGIPLARHELVAHPQALGPVHGLAALGGPAKPEKPGHDQRLRGAAIRVQALKNLFHENQRIKAGEVFTLTDPKKFKSGQMVEVTSEQPAKPAKDFAADPFPFPAVARVKRGIPGQPRTAQGTRPALDARAGLEAGEAEAGDPTVLE